MKSVGVLILAVAVTFGYTQAPDTLWTKTYGGTEDDYANSVLLTADGGYIFVGETNSFGAGEGDVWIVKTDSSGNILWTKSYGDTTQDFAAAIRHTTDGAYIIVGAIQDSVWLLKIDENGDTLWAKTIKPLWCDMAMGYDIKQTTDSGYIITGVTGFDFGSPALLLKTDSLGDTLWVASNTPGGCYGYSVQQTSDGGYVIAGTSTIWPSGLVLFKTDSLGNLIWSTGLYMPPHFNFSGRCVHETADGGYMTCGTLWSKYGLYRTNMYGDTLWTRRFDFAGYVWGNANSLIITSSGNLLTAGFIGDPYGSDALFLKTDSLGNQLWEIAIGDLLTDRVINCVLQTADNGYIAAGNTNASGAGGYDAWLVKLGPDIGVAEQPINIPVSRFNTVGATIFTGPLILPTGKNCRIFDITGRVVEPDKIQPGIYFIEIDGVVTQKVIKIK